MSDAAAPRWRHRSVARALTLSSSTAARIHGRPRNCGAWRGRPAPDIGERRSPACPGLAISPARRAGAHGAPSWTTTRSLRPTGRRRCAQPSTWRRRRWPPWAGAPCRSGPPERRRIMSRSAGSSSCPASTKRVEEPLRRDATSAVPIWRSAATRSHGSAGSPTASAASARSCSAARNPSWSRGSPISAWARFTTVPSRSGTAFRRKGSPRTGWRGGLSGRASPRWR